MKKIISTVSATLLTFSLVSAQSTVGRSLENVVSSSNRILVMVYSSLFVVALILFFVGIFKYLAPGQGAENKKEGYKYMGFGLVALFVMVSVWGIVAFMADSVGVNPNVQFRQPSIPAPAQTTN